MLILASASPRRRELMEKLHMPFFCEAASDPEVIPDGMPAALVPEYLAEHKAAEILHRRLSLSAGFSEQTGASEPLTVIGSDTVVLCDGKILGKPKDSADAAHMLHLLSGRTHEVLTGVCILSATENARNLVWKCSFTSRTEVTFYPLSDEEISSYIATEEPMDKAGAYGIQGGGALLVKNICGDYYTVMGFPIAEIARKLKEL